MIWPITSPQTPAAVSLVVLLLPSTDHRTRYYPLVPRLLNIDKVMHKQNPGARANEHTGQKEQSIGTVSATFVPCVMTRSNNA